MIDQSARPSFITATRRSRHFVADHAIIWSVILIVFFLITGVQGQALDRVAPPEDFMQQASESMYQGRYQTALQAFESAIESAKQKLDDINAANRNRNATVDVREPVLTLKNAYLGQIEVYRQLGQLDQAENTCLILLREMEKRLTANHPQTLEVLLCFAALRQQQFSYSDAHLACLWCAEVSQQLGEDAKFLRVASARELGKLYEKAKMRSESLSWLERSLTAAKSIEPAMWVESECELAHAEVSFEPACLDIAIDKLMATSKELPEDENAKSLRLLLEFTSAQLLVREQQYTRAIKTIEQAVAGYGGVVTSHDRLLHGRLMLLWSEAARSSGDIATALNKHRQASDVLALSISPTHVVRAELLWQLAEIRLAQSVTPAGHVGARLMAALQLCRWVDQRFTDAPDAAPPTWQKAFLNCYARVATAKGDQALRKQLDEQLHQIESRQRQISEAIKSNRNRFVYADLDAVAQRSREVVHALRANMNGRDPFVDRFAAPTFQMQMHRSKQSMQSIMSRNAGILNPYTMGNLGFQQFQESVETEN